jgi:hypothetical protein
MPEVACNLTVRISSNPSRMLFETPGASRSRLSTGRGISPFWGVQFFPVGGLAISRLRDQRLHSLVVDRDALRALERKPVG